MCIAVLMRSYLTQRLDEYINNDSDNNRREETTLFSYINLHNHFCWRATLFPCIVTFPGPNMFRSLEMLPLQH